MSILDYSPAFSLENSMQLAQNLFGLNATAKSLPSERDQNFLLQSKDGKRFVLKIANATEDKSLLEAQNQVMGYLSKSITFCPNVIPANNGEEVAKVKSSSGSEHFVRLVTYLDGMPLGNITHHSDDLLYDLGFKIGQLTSALQGFDHHAIHRDFHWDLANGLDVVHKNMKLIQDSVLLDTVMKLASDFELHTAPLLPDLRQSIIHNDANDYNLLAGGGENLYTRNQSIIGLIDFGDMVHSFTVGDLAVAIAYAVLGKPDPLIAASQIVKGFHSTYPLEENELSALFGLVTLRLCMSVSIAAEQQAGQPDNEYLGISQGPIRDTLPNLAAIHPRFAEAIFRKTCGLPPFPNYERIVNWLSSNRDSCAPLLDFDLRAGTSTVLDLSVSSSLISSDPSKNEEPHLTARIHAALDDANAQVGIGRYNEARYFYTTPTFSTGDNITDEYRTVHLGIDLFAPTDTPIYSPLDGKVFAFANNNSQQDYGPVIILEHISNDCPTFYTLYGHLSRASLKGLKKGQKISQGEQFATIGKPEANGGWTPHLHFQVITDLFELGNDFPGVARPSQRGVWLGICPDPNLILGIPSNKFPAPKPAKDETLKARRQRLGSNLSVSYTKPLKIVRGWKQYLFDDAGRKYLDVYNNVAHVGHNHPRVIDAARRQIGVLNTNTRYLHDNINRYAEKLTSMLPETLRVCYFVNSGSEANELALRLARTYTGQRDLIVLDAAYHGNTTTMIDISPYKHNGPGGSGTPDWVHVAPIPDDYRGAFKREDPQAGAKYAREVQKIIADLNERGRGLSAYIAESLPSVGGQIIPPPGYLAEVYRYVREVGGLCIADEVQTGFGRVGTHFWGFEMQDVTPDVVVLGKPIGAGHPLAAVITTPEIAKAFDNGMEYFNTFGGNPVSCAIGMEVLNVVLDENLQKHAKHVGERMLAGLQPLVDQYSIVGDVRGSGLFLGVELVRDRDTLEPAGEEAAYVADRMREQGILLGTDGPYHNVVKIRPPMPFDEENADYLVSTMKKVLEELEETLSI